MKKFFAAAVCAVFLVVAAVAQQPAPAGNSAPAESAQPAIPPPAHPITPTQTKEIFQITGMQTMLRSVVRQMLAGQRANAPEWIPSSIWNDLENGMAAIDFATLLYPTYSQYLSEEDAIKAIEFYRTPEGQHFIQVTPFAMAAAGDIGRREGARIAQEIFASHQQELLDAKTKYDAQRKQEIEQMTKPEPPASNKH
jgi:hypothetical protein